MPAAVTSNHPMTSLEWSMLLALSVLWGGSFFFVGVAVKELPPLTIVVLRVALAALALLLMIWFLGMRLPRARGTWSAFFGMGFLNNVVPFVLIVWGQTHIASGVASILNATVPLFAMIVAHVFTADDKLTGRRLAGVVVGFVGVAIMIGGAALQGLGVGVMAQLAILAAAISYAFAGVYGRRFQLMGVAPIVTATGQVTASSLMLTPVMLIVDQPWTLPFPSLNTLGALVGLALLSTALGYVLYFRILATAGAINLLLVTFLIPVSAILPGIVVLGETLQPKHLVGMALIGTGLATIDGRPLKAFQRHFSSLP
ncbi:MAG TPA: DMT family transporter [Burkholderiales bacterium]|nr:DMT family transporter [Burkholderiales bacterium]